MTRRDLEFTAEVRALAVARHTIGGVLRCPCCGLPVLSGPDFHHRKRKRRGEGDGRLANALPVHGHLEAGRCHFTAVHLDVAAARYRRWILPSWTPEEAYAEPVWDQARGLWAVFLADGPLWRPASDTEIGDIS